LPYSTLTKNAAISLIPYAHDPCDCLVRFILDKYQHQLPVLDSLTVIIEEPSQSSLLRKQISSEIDKLGFQALLGLEFITLKDWALNQASTQESEIIHHGRELLLIEALKEFPDLLNDSDPWRLCETLLSFFDELSLNQIELDSDYSSFNQRILDAYHLPEQLIPHCMNETKIVHTLWNAWRAQLKELNLIDFNQYYAQQLTIIANNKTSLNDLIFLGVSSYSQSENYFIAKLLEDSRANVFINISIPEVQVWPNTKAELLAKQLLIELSFDDCGCPQTQFFDQVFQQQEPQFKDRAMSFAKHCPASPIANQLSIFTARSFEQEAQAIEIQIRLWIKHDIKSIGIIVENRKLARRLRALLERSRIHVHDLAGWTLSSTSAATVVERWLECLESNFAYQAFLDLLKSPFVNLVENRELFETLIYRLEHDIIIQQNVGVNLDDYIAHLEIRSKKLGWKPGSTKALKDILKIFKSLQKNMLPYLSHKAVSVYELVENFIKSLDAIGILDKFRLDDAGIQLLETLQLLKSTAQNINIKLNWSDFRQWISQTLEHAHYKPKVESRTVSLLTLAQSKLMKFERIIIASNEQSLFPGQASLSPYFNHQVRAELGLKTWHDYAADQFSDYRRLLEAVDYKPNISDSTVLYDFKILLTRTSENEGEEVPASPWLEAIQSFHQLAYNDNLENNFLDEACLHLRTDNRTQPDIIKLKPSHGSTVVVKDYGLPETLSVSNHQQLINCPYQFFCATSLKLKPSEEVRDQLSKLDYGHRVHLCLQAFHSNLESYSGPFAEKLTELNRSDAISLLFEISDEVFAKDIENNFQHNVWLSLWKKRIPDYVDWQIKHAENHDIKNSEEYRTIALTESVAIKGIIDRVDIDENNQNCLIDYKTGAPPSKQDVLNGESIQLLSYALLYDKVASIEYLRLSNLGAKSVVRLEADTLTQAAEQTHDRLMTMIKQLSEGQAMHAWGDTNTCRLCDMSGICRQQSWITE